MTLGGLHVAHVPRPRLRARHSSPRVCPARPLGFGARRRPGSGSSGPGVWPQACCGRRPFTQADQLFSVTWADPMPRHLLEAAYLEDKSTLSERPYWTTEFVGAGPYRMREFTPGSRIMLEAFGDFALGRPKIDEVELRYMPDPNVIVTNAIAGVVDFTLGQRVPLDTAVEMQDRWREGKFTFEIADHRA